MKAPVPPTPQAVETKPEKGGSAKGKKGKGSAGKKGGKANAVAAPEPSTPPPPATPPGEKGIEQKKFELLFHFQLKLNVVDVPKTVD